jgi:hypothetical protein
MKEHALAEGALSDVDGAPNEWRWWDHNSAWAAFVSQLM